MNAARGVWHIAPIAAAVLLSSLTMIPAARAQPVPGFYIGGAVGLSLLATQATTLDILTGVSPAAGLSAKPGFSPGFEIVGSAGYVVGNGLRFEIETNYADNAQSQQSGSESRYGVFTNALYDFDFDVPWITPYLGAGVGYQLAQWNDAVVTSAGAPGGPISASLHGTTGNFAFQIIAGLAFPVAAVDGLSITAEYRFTDAPGARKFGGATTGVAVPGNAQARSNGEQTHSFLLGVRYAFNTAPVDEDDMSALPAATPQMPPAARTYVVYFDAASASLSAQAQDVVAEAARASNRVAYTRIEISGHTDKTGAQEDSVELSKARSEAVAQEMVRWGITRSVIDIHAFGDQRPLVKAAATTPEARNRRVEIVYR